MTGLLLVNKPAGMTSHDVVDRIRRAAGTRRVGHTGTLDPGATGLLILCLGGATRLSEHLTGLDKVYEGVMRFGVVTDSYDLDGAVVEEHAVPALTLEQIQGLCDRYTGEIDQIPPMVSAVKVGGERLYKKARKGEVVEREARRVTVREFKVLSYAAPDAHVRVCCTRGTYVRSLCHDVGQELGCGAVLASLCRTWVGKHSVEHALPLDAFTGPEVVEQRLLSMDDALDLPVVVVRDASRGLVFSGTSLSANDLLGGCPVLKDWVQIKSTTGKLLALGIAECSAMGARVHPKRVFQG
jgi:tRNA pseudouridine55 synthase